MKKSAMIMAAGAATLLAAASANAAWLSENGVTVYTNQVNWEAAVAANNRVVQTLETTAGNMALANEVSSPPGDNTNLGKTLTFDKANTGFDTTFSLYASSGVSGNGFVYNDDEGSGVVWPDVLSVGDIDNAENDNVKLNILSGASVYATGFDIIDNEFGTDEGLYIYDSSNTLIADFNTEPLVGGNGSTLFLGVVSTTEIGQMFFDEAETGDDMGIANIKIDAIPEPATLGMLGLFGGAIFGIRRIFLI